MKIPFSPVSTLSALLFALPLAGVAQVPDAPTTATPSSTISTASPTPAPLPSTIAPPPAVPATVHHIRRLVRDMQASSDNIKSQGNFGAQLWLIGNEGFFQDWRKPESPSIDPVDLIVRGQSIYTAIIFYGPSHDDKGLSYVTYDIVIRRPDGTVYDQRQGMVGYQTLAPSDEKMLELGRTYVTVNTTANDPVGQYTVETTVHDNAAKIDLSLKDHFIVH